MKMTIEYDILGVTFQLPVQMTDEGIKAAQKAGEYNLRSKGVFGEIKHEVVRDDEEGFLSLHCSGKRLIKEFSMTVEEIIKECEHMYLCTSDRINGKCSKCGIRFSEWHG